MQRPLTAPFAVRSTVEYDQNSYHVWIYPGATATVADTGTAPSASRRPEITVTLRLRTPTGLAHYVRVPIPFPTPWGGWPSHIQFDVTEENIDALATEKTGTLLCPKLWQTTTH